MKACGRCRAELSADARYCGACGAPTREHRRAQVNSHTAAIGASRRASLALAAACGVPLLMFAVMPTPENDWLTLLSGPLLVLLGGAAVTAINRDWRAGIGSPPNWRWCLLALPVTAASVALAWSLLGLVRGDGEWRLQLPASFWIIAVVLAPLTEEWLCRGATWPAAVALSGPRGACVLTAILFATLHGMNGAWLLELPHRFLFGLAYGWLRWRSDSLVPGILAHALHNAAVLCWF